MSRTQELILQNILEECINAMLEAHDSMFTQCWSNPIKNAWGKEVNVSKINELQSIANNAKAVLMSHRGTPNG